MKKSLIFAFVAVVAMIAVSCKPKADAPKARFTYVADGLTVTFSNVSKDADTYAWEFGDGQVSDQKDPVHTYAAAGTYTVKLTAKNAGGENSMTENIELKAKAFKITIDGNFDDWKDVPADLLAEAKVDEMAVYEELYKMRFVSDASYVYFYMEFNADPEAVHPIDMMIDTDGAEGTGMSTWLWANSGVEILIEGFPRQFEDAEGVNSGYADAGIFKWIGDTPDAWAWDALDIAGALQASEVKEIGNGVAAFEGSILRSSLPKLTAFKVGVFCSNVDWDESGSLPQTTIGEEGNVAQPMLDVKLN